jgi:hypothetical protein
MAWPTLPIVAACGVTFRTAPPRDVQGRTARLDAGTGRGEHNRPARELELVMAAATKLADKLALQRGDLKLTSKHPVAIRS